MKKLTLLRFHDGAAKPNWGGRGTSMALLQLLDRPGVSRVKHGVNGASIISGFDATVASEGYQPIAGRSESDRRQAIRAGIVRGDSGKRTQPSYNMTPRERAAQLLAKRDKLPIVDALLASFEDVDAVVMNGEGDFILRRRTSLWRSMVLMELALGVGREVHLVNTILSPAEHGFVDPKVKKMVGDLMERCASVIYRDPSSKELSDEFFPAVRSSFCPDALFSWHETTKVIGTLAHKGPLDEFLHPETRAAMAERYVVLSGGSAKMSDEEKSRALPALATVIERLAALNVKVVVAATCTGDNWMLAPALKAGAAVVPPTVPLATAARVLSGAAAYVSGRYHPGILASTMGTPCVFMRSNSHKTRSLPIMLQMQDPVEHPFFCDETDFEPMFTEVEQVLAREHDLRSRLFSRAGELSAQASGLVDLMGLAH